MDLVFSRDELEILKKKNLIKVAKFYGVKIHSNWSKRQIIDAIIPTQSDTNYPEVSVRLKRIIENNKGV